MKTLYLIRHAKSSWEDTTIPDFGRPLNKRGETDAPRMAKRLKEKEVHPNLLISSPAKRALATCEKFSEILGYPEANIQTDRALYHADEEQILSVIKNIKNSIEVVLLFGHNPGLTDFANEFGSDIYIDNIPTCGIVCFTIEEESWNQVTWKKNEMRFFDFPKNKKD